MNCKGCRSSFSDLLERSLPEGLRTEVREHLTRCPSCEKELRELRSSLKLLRATPPEEPPPDLADKIVARLSSRPQKSKRNGAARPKAVRPRRFTAARWAVAAALPLIALGGYSLGQRGVSRLEGLIASNRTEAGEKLAKLELSWEEQRTRLEGELRDARAAVVALRDSAGEAGEAIRLANEQAEERQAELSDKLALRDGELAELRAQFAEFRGKAERLQSELNRLASRAGSPSSRLVPAFALLADGSERRDRPRLTHQESVSFRKRGDRYEVVVSGPHEEVLPELLEWARDSSEPHLASLALGAAENLLEPLTELEEDLEVSGEPAPRGFLNRLNAGLGGIAREVGFEPSDDGALLSETPGESNHQRRLRRLEREWEAFQASRKQKK